MRTRTFDGITNKIWLFVGVGADWGLAGGICWGMIIVTIVN